MKIKYTILVLGIAFSFTNAQVDLEINNGMTVETTGGVSVELSGNLIENGTGYFDGVVTSGTRGSGISSFAGLDLTTGSVEKITRTTGTALSATSPKTTLRSYEVVNTSPTFSSDVTSAIVTSETNNIAEQYVYTKNGTTWEGYSDNSSTASSIKAAGVDILNGTSNITVAEGVGIAAKIYLEGPYQGSNLMADNLGTLPSVSPFSEAPRTASSIPTSAVDWVLVEIRTGTAANTVIGYRSAFVDINGNIINDDDTDLATAGIGMPGIGGTPYYIVVKHRNHLGVMSNTTQTLSWMTP